MISLKKILLTEGSIGDKVKKDFELLKSVVEKTIESFDITHSEKKEEIKTWKLIGVINTAGNIQKYNINLSDGFIISIFEIKDAVYKYDFLPGYEFQTYEDLFKIFESANPVPRNKSITEWLLKHLYKHNILIEDFDKIKNYISIFEKNKSKLPEEKRNIFNYENYKRLYNTLKEYGIYGNAAGLTGKEINEFIKSGDIENLGETENFKFYKILTVKGSCAIGKNTEWCTAKYAANDSRNMFSNYNKQSPLIVIVDKTNGNRYQYHSKSKQFMDEDDNDVKEEIKYNFEIIKFLISKSLFDIISLNYNIIPLNKIQELFKDNDLFEFIGEIQRKQIYKYKNSNISIMFYPINNKVYEIYVLNDEDRGYLKFPDIYNEGEEDRRKEFNNFILNNKKIYKSVLYFQDKKNIVDNSIITALGGLGSEGRDDLNNYTIENSNIEIKDKEYGIYTIERANFSNSNIKSEKQLTYERCNISNSNLENIKYIQFRNSNLDNSYVKTKDSIIFWGKNKLINLSLEIKDLESCVLNYESEILGNYFRVNDKEYNPQILMNIIKTNFKDKKLFEFQNLAKEYEIILGS